MANVIVPGAKVHVEFDAVVSERESAGFINLILPKGWKVATFWFPNESIAKVIEPTDWEKYGPPEVGDIWEANGVEFVMMSSVVATRITGFATYRPEYTRAEMKTLNPRLIRRRGMVTYDHDTEDKAA